MQFKELGRDLKYKNPYGDKKGLLIRRNPRVISVNGGMIVKVSCSQYDYLVAGEVVSQRAGASLELLELFIEEDLKPCDYDHQFEITKKLKGLKNV